jgi:hypothetical protein
LEAVKERFNPEHDTCQDKITDIKRYTLQGKKTFKYRHNRELPPEVSQKAVAYIRALVKRYPFQLRYVLALPYWYRFTEAWCDSGDEDIAMRAI